MKAYDTSYQYKAKKVWKNPKILFVDFIVKNCFCRDKKCDLGKYPTDSNERGLK